MRLLPGIRSEAPRTFILSRPQHHPMDTETWHQIKGRPQAVRAHRAEILDATSDAIADKMPAHDASTFEYRQFLNSHAGVVTRQLNDSTDVEEAGA